MSYGNKFYPPLPDLSRCKPLGEFDRALAVTSDVNRGVTTLGVLKRLSDAGAVGSARSRGWHVIGIWRLKGVKS